MWRCHELMNSKCKRFNKVVNSSQRCLNCQSNYPLYRVNSLWVSLVLEFICSFAPLRIPQEKWVPCSILVSSVNRQSNVFYHLRALGIDLGSSIVDPLFFYKSSGVHQADWSYREMKCFLLTNREIGVRKGDFQPSRNFTSWILRNFRWRRFGNLAPILRNLELDSFTSFWSTEEARSVKV